MSTDRMNPALRAEVEGLRGSMAAAAERRAALPARFTTEPAGTGSQVKITDTVTGRSTTVGLCDYGGAIQVLAAFFAAEATTEDVEFCFCTNTELEAGRVCESPVCPNRTAPQRTAPDDRCGGGHRRIPGKGKT